MYFFDFGLVIKFWFVLFIIGIIFLPITNRIFGSLADKGYIFSKVLGIITISYIAFVLGTLHIAPFGIATLFFIIVTYLILVILFYKFKIPKFYEKKIRRIWVMEEAIFLLALTFWSYVKGFQPDINGLEKFMDFGFINSILRTNYFPAADMWFSPEPINYYYFGHLQTAVLTLLSGINSYITYNLMLAAIFAFCFVGGFSIVFSLLFDLYKKKMVSILGGLLSAALLTLGGNLHIIYAFFESYTGESPVPFWQLNLLPLTSFGLGYWYPNATRFIQNTIHEFPSYSFVVSDLHGHVLDIPTVLLTLAVFYVLIKSKKINLYQIILLSFLSSIMYMTNAWDGIIYPIITTVIIISKYTYLIPHFKLKEIFSKRLISKLKPFIFSVAQKILILGLGFLIFTIPFNAYFKPFATGIGVVCAPDFLTEIEFHKSTSGELIKGKLGPFLFEKDHCQRSPLYQVLILWGFFLIIYIIFVINIIKKSKKYANFKPIIFALILFTTSSVLILIPEFIYAKDIYPAHYRANTMFKLGYQAYIMFSLASGFAIIMLIKSWKKIILIPLFSIMVSLIMIYPYFSIKSYFGNLTPERYQGLNGIAYLEFRYPDDYKAIMWLRENIKGQAVIAEAQGDSYTDYARVSANTGLPTILGWTVHEWLWRGDYSVPEPRIDEVRALYEDGLTKTNEIIEKYNVKYIFIGNLEREKYLNINESKFNQIATPIFKSGQTIVYQVN